MPHQTSRATNNNNNNNNNSNIRLSGMASSASARVSREEMLVALNDCKAATLKTLCKFFGVSSSFWANHRTRVNTIKEMAARLRDLLIPEVAAIPAAAAVIEPPAARKERVAVRIESDGSRHILDSDEGEVSSNEREEEEKEQEQEKEAFT
jgi:hypothetical protein